LPELCLPFAQYRHRQSPEQNVDGAALVNLACCLQSRGGGTPRDYRKKPAQQVNTARE